MSLEVVLFRLSCIVANQVIIGVGPTDPIVKAIHLYSLYLLPLPSVSLGPVYDVITCAF